MSKDIRNQLKFIVATRLDALEHAKKVFGDKDYYVCKYDPTSFKKSNVQKIHILSEDILGSLDSNEIKISCFTYFGKLTLSTEQVSPDDTDIQLFRTEQEAEDFILKFFANHLAKYAISSEYIPDGEGRGPLDLYKINPKYLANKYFFIYAIKFDRYSKTPFTDFECLVPTIGKVEVVEDGFEIVIANSDGGERRFPYLPHFKVFENYLYAANRFSYSIYVAQSCVLGKISTNKKS